MNNEYMCLSCLNISSKHKDEEFKCPRCGGKSSMKTYNASDSSDITDIDFHG